MENEKGHADRPERKYGSGEVLHFNRVCYLPFLAAPHMTPHLWCSFAVDPTSPEYQSDEDEDWDDEDQDEEYDYVILSKTL